MATPFGAPMREHFLLDPAYKNLNHGSFGTYPREIQKTLHTLQSQVEASPDIFLRQTQPRLLAESRAAVAKLLNVPASTCVFVKNATTGVNTVLHNLPFTEKHALIYFDTVYGGVERGLVWLSGRTGVKLRKVKYVLPVRGTELVQLFRQTVDDVKCEGLNPVVAVFDTIVSNPGVRFPFEALVRVCRELGVWSCIDGAHGIGHVALDLGALKPDFFTSNCHKWLYTPRGSAVLYVAPQHQHLIRTTLPTSWGFIPAPSDNSEMVASTMTTSDPRTPFEQLFDFVATSDDTPYLCVPAALEFREKVCGGEDAIHKYLVELASIAGETVAKKLGTEVMTEPGLEEGEESQLRKCGMVNVRLPLSIDDSSSSSGGGGEVSVNGAKTAAFLQNVLMEEYKTFVPVFVYGGALWTRLSAQVYLEKSDFEWLADVLAEACGKVLTMSELKA